MRQVWSCKTSKLPLRFRKFFFQKLPCSSLILWLPCGTPIHLYHWPYWTKSLVALCLWRGVCAFASPRNGVVERQKQAERSDRITQTGRSLSLAGVSPSAGGTTPSTCTSTCTSTTTSGKAGRRSCLAPFPVCSTWFLCRWGWAHTS